MKPYKCKNKDCKQVLGYASVDVFETGGILLDRRTVFACQACGRRHVWGPVMVERVNVFDEARQEATRIMDNIEKRIAERPPIRIT